MYSSNYVNAESFLDGKIVLLILFILFICIYKHRISHIRTINKFKLLYNIAITNEIYQIYVQ